MYLSKKENIEKLILMVQKYPITYDRYDDGGIQRCKEKELYLG